MRLPRRNIYIKQKNLKIFERAAAHGNISQVIVEALKMYVKNQDLRQESFKSYGVQSGDLTYRFLGRKIKTITRGDTTIVVYQTRGDNFVIHQSSEAEEKVKVCHSIVELVEAISDLAGDAQGIVKALRKEKIVWID